MRKILLCFLILTLTACQGLISTATPTATATFTTIPSQTPTFTLTIPPTPTLFGGGRGEILFFNSVWDNPSVSFYSLNGDIQKSDFRAPGYVVYRAQVSPDGKFVALILSSLKMAGGEQLWILDVSSRTWIFMQDAPYSINPYTLSWSPDSYWITFAGAEKRSSDRWKVYIINNTGTIITRIPGNAPDIVTAFPGGWSPDSRTLLLYSTLIDDSGATGGNAIYAYGAGSSFLEKMTDNLENFRPKFSPDGSKIAYYSHRYGLINLDIYIANSNGTGEMKVTDESRCKRSCINYFQEWTPDGKALVYWRWDSTMGYPDGRGGSRGYECVIQVDMSYEVCFGISEGYMATGNFSEQVFSPNGEILAMACIKTKPEETNICLGNLKDHSLVEIDGDYPPSFSPDGSMIAYSTGENLNIYNIETGEITELTNGFKPIWLP